MILEEATKEAFGYYPRDLKPKSGKPILAACELCGRFRVTRKNDYHTFCLLCSSGGERSSKWRGGGVKCICLICGKEFEVTQSAKEKGCGKYCSLSCAAINRMHNAKPEMTAPEKAFDAMCIKNHWPFTNNVNAKRHIGNAIPDFIHTSKKIVVEVLGNYWHSIWLGFEGVGYKQTVEGRTAQLKAEGYKTIILWEADVMREDAEIFVKRLLTKRGII